MSFWNGKRALVTGGAGFLGSYVVDKLRERGCGEVFVPRSKDYDLTQLPAVQKLYGDSRPDIVIHPSTSPSTRSGRWLRAGSGGAGGRHPAPLRFGDCPTPLRCGDSRWREP